jgi:hypothetical protein
LSKESYQSSLSVRLRNPIKRRPRPEMGCSAIKKKKKKKKKKKMVYIFWHFSSKAETE